MCDDKSFMSKNENYLSKIAKLDSNKAGVHPINYGEDEYSAAKHGMSRSLSGYLIVSSQTSIVLDEEINGFKNCDRIPYVNSDILRSENSTCELDHNLIIERKWSPNFEFGNCQDVADDFTNIASNEREWSSDGGETVASTKILTKNENNSILTLDLSPMTSYQNNVCQKEVESVSENELMVNSKLEADLENLQKVGFYPMLDHKTIPANIRIDHKSLPLWDSQNNQVVFPLPIKENPEKKDKDQVFTVVNDNNEEKEKISMKRHKTAATNNVHRDTKQVIDQETKELIKLLDKKVDKLIIEVGQMKECPPANSNNFEKRHKKNFSGKASKKQLAHRRKNETFEKTQEKLCKPLCVYLDENLESEKNKNKVCTKQKRREFIEKLTRELLEVPKKHAKVKTGIKSSLFNLKEPIVYPINNYKSTNCRKQECEHLKDFRKVLSLAQLKALMPLLIKLENIGKNVVKGKELYELVQVNQIHSKGLTLYKACEVCCAWEKRGKNNNCKIEMEEALFAISKPDDYLRIYALKNENLMKMAVVSWEMEKYNDDMVAKKKQYLFEKPRSLYARPGRIPTRQMNCSAGLSSKDVSEYSLWIQAARVDGHSSVELEAFYKNAMKNIKNSTFHSEIVEKSPFSPLQVLPEIKKLTHSINETKKNERKLTTIKKV